MQSLTAGRLEYFMADRALIITNMLDIGREILAAVLAVLPLLLLLFARAGMAVDGLHVGESLTATVTPKTAGFRLNVSLCYVGSMLLLCRAGHVAHRALQRLWVRRRRIQRVL